MRRLQRLAAELGPILACGDAARALVTGSSVLAGSCRDWAMQDGKRGRLGVLATSCAICAKAIEIWPATGAGVAGAWVIAAWMHAPPPPATEHPPGETAEAPPEGAQEPPLIDDRAAFLEWLADLIGTANGVHLDPLWEALSEEPGCALPRAHLGPLLDRLQVPVQRTVSVAGVAGRSGVRRADVQAALTALPQERQEALSETAETAVDLRKSHPLSAPSQPLSPPLSGA